MIEIYGGIRAYSWGRPGALTSLFGTAPTGGPEAELWLGAHPSNPARAIDGTALGDIVAADPTTWLGPEHRTLPYLLKVLAADIQLSLQAHPNATQASEGYAQEEAAGVSLADPARTFRDRHPKPEMLVALTDMDALIGFAPAAASARALQELATDRLRADPTYPRVLDALHANDLRKAVLTLLAPESASFACALTAAAAASSSPMAHVITAAAADFAGDRGIGVAALLNPLHLRPGQAVFVDVGIMHSYVRGIGVELQTPSDNVLRAGLTPKHVDTAGLARIAHFTASQPHLIEPERTQGQGWRSATYTPPAPFTLTCLQFDEAATVALPGSGPRIVLGIGGPLRLARGEDYLEPQAGGAGFVGAAETGVSVQAAPPTTVWIAAAGGSK